MTQERHTRSADSAPTASFPGQVVCPPADKGAEMKPAPFEYLRLRANSRQPFLDVVPIRFSVASPREQCHVPFLPSPYGYATYRGS